ncbi:hypothetical protein P5V15_004093 [Pogonomyrmex californicus]
MQFACKMNPRNTQFSCTFCPYKSMYKANMERHVRNVHNTGTLKFRCELLEQEYNANDEQQLQRLSFIYENCETYVCADCGKAYAAKRSLWRHQKFECVNAKPRLRCDMCSYNTPHKWSYRKMYMGDQVLGYTCTMCSKFYKMWSNYLKHKCEPPQFKCPLCPFAAFKAFILHAHQAEQHFKVPSPNT